jgi:hypothetical protein
VQIRVAGAHFEGFRAMAQNMLLQDVALTGQPAVADSRGGMMDDPEVLEANANPDLLTGAPGSHPVGVSVGATGGAFTGAAVGATVGLVGALVGAAVGGVAGGLAGKEAAETIDPTLEEAHWSNSHATRPYALGHDYMTYQPAYRYGWESYSTYDSRSFEEMESDLERDWEQHRGNSTLGWDRARDAARDAWQRVDDYAKGRSVRR